MTNEQNQLPKIPAAPPAEIAFSEADISTRYDDVFEETRPDILEKYSRNGAGNFIFHAQNGVSLKIEVCSPDIVKLRYAPDGRFETEFSYAVDPRFRAVETEVFVVESEEKVELQIGDLGCQVSRDGLLVRFFDLFSGRTFCEETAPFSARRTINKGICEVRISKKAARREAFFGLGDKTCGVNLRGKKYSNWCSDSFGFGRETDENYRAIPFYLAHNQGLAYGIFVDNSYRSTFNFDSEGEGEVAFSAEGGEMRYYFLAGKNLTDVARRYTDLTGRPELPPLWALGFHQSRWSYFPESRVLELADTFRREEIPCDAIWLDIDYMDGYRCFTWDAGRFPEPAKLTAELEARGFKTVAMIDPGIKGDPEYSIFKEGLEKDFFLKKADGQLALGPVWPGWCAFPDFTKKRVRAWWGELFHELLVKNGLSGIWIDMNEPAVFHVNHKTLPDDVLHDHDGQPTSHRKAHNIYGQQMARATYEGIKKLRPERRPFLLSRASFSGGQRHAALWTGDNLADWEHLQLANIQCQRLAVSGFSFVGTDIGGFVGQPDGELMVRWLQLAAFHPFMRAHYSGQHTLGDALEPIADDGLRITDSEIENPQSVIRNPQSVFTHEPFSFGEKWTPLAKKAIELRYHLLPSIYTAFRRHVLDGTPMLRHLFFEDPTDAKLLDNERDFLFGEHILVSPVVISRLQRQSVYLPKGNWFYFWTGQAARGGTDFFATIQPEQIPFFVREGAVLPIWPTRKWTGEKPIDELTLYVYYKNGIETSQLYEDDGEGYAYKMTDFSLKNYTLEGTPDRLKLTQEKAGDWKETYQKVVIYLVGLPFFIKKCKVDKEEMAIKEIRLRERSIYKLDVGPDFKMIELN